MVGIVAAVGASIVVQDVEEIQCAIRRRQLSCNRALIGGQVAQQWNARWVRVKPIIGRCACGSVAGDVCGKFSASSEMSRQRGQEADKAFGAFRTELKDSGEGYSRLVQFALPSQVYQPAK